MISKNKIKWIRSLHLKKNRDESKLFIIEGEKLLEEALVWAHDKIQEIYYTSSCKLIDKVESNKLKYEVTESDLEKISCLKKPNKVLAILSYFEVSETENNFKVVLDDIQDPGNLGTIIRTADWFGFNEIICSKNTVDCYNPKVVQATMGALFRVKITYSNLRDIFQHNNLPVYGALLNGENIYEKSFTKNGILLLGNEGNGISKELHEFIDNPITIPSFGNTESLNVSTAMGILLFQIKKNNF
jgi:RNA methyltransferase, TrmH family